MTCFAVQASEELSKLLIQMKVLLNGDGGPSARPPRLTPPRHRDGRRLELTRLLPAAEYEPISEAVAQLAQEVYASDLLHLLVLNIWRFEFEVSAALSACRTPRPG